MLKRIGAEESGEFKAIASGTLPSGKPVAVNADGTVSVIGTTVITETVGSAVVFADNGNVTFIASTYDSSNNRVVVAYRDNGNSQRGTAVVGTISGTSVSFGTPVVFQASRSDDIAITFDSSSNKVIIAYRDHDNSYYGTAIVGTVSGTSISFGTKVTFNSGATNDISLVHDSSNNKTVIAYKNDSNNYGYAIVGTVSGTSISFGSAAAFASHTIYETKIAYDSANGKVVIAYTNASQQGTAIVGTVSSTSISFGSATAFDTGEIAFIDIAYDVASGKSVIVFMKGPGGNAGAQAIVGTVSSTSISFGTAVVYDSGSGNEWNTVVYHADAEKVIVVYWDNSNSDRATAITGTVSGTSISFDNSVVLEDGAISYISPAYDSTNKVVFVAVDDGGNSNYGTGVVYQPTYSSQNLTSENYIGMSRGVVNYDLATQAIGTPSIMNAGSTTGFAAAFDSNEGKVVVAYADNSGSGIKGKAAVGTVNAANNSISFGSEVVFQDSEITGDQMDCVFDSSNNKVVIFYTDTNNPSTDDRTGTAIVGTVSGTSISFGTKAAFESGNTQEINACFDSTNNKFVVTYRDADNSNYATAAVGTVSGTDISFGTPVVFNSAGTTASISVDFDANAGKVVVVYQDSGDGAKGKAIVGTVSGTSISFGSEVTFDSGVVGHTEVVYDASAQKVVIAYLDALNSDRGTAFVGTVSGTSISFGSAAIFNSGASQNIRGVYDSNAQKILLLYKDGGNSNRPTIAIGTVSGTSISFGSEVVVMDVQGATILSGVAFDSTNNKVVLSYIDTTGSDNGMAQVVQLAYDNTTRANIADGGNASVDIIGSVVDNQNSLTTGQQYFVQNDGTISTTADSPSVLAGTAISATELLVKT